MPDGNRIPYILDGRVVVDGSSPQQGMAVDIDLLGEAYVRVVPVETVGDPVPRSLNEGAEIVGDLTAGEKTRLLQDKIVIHPKSGGCAARLCGLSIRKSRLQHDRKRRALPIPATQGVAAELKAAAKRRQLPKSRMAGRARLSGLASIKRQADGAPWRQIEYKHDGNYSADENGKRSAHWQIQHDRIAQFVVCRISAKSRQEPCGLIGPSTILHAFGAWNCTHLSHRLSPSG